MEQTMEMPVINVVRCGKGNSVCQLQIVGHFQQKHCNYISGVHNMAHDLLSDNASFSEIKYGYVKLGALNKQDIRIIKVATELILGYIAKFKLKCQIKESRIQ